MGRHLRPHFDRPPRQPAIVQFDGGPFSVLDLGYDEDARAEVDMNVVMNAQGRYVEVQGASESQPFDRTTLNRLLDLAAGGIGELLRIQREALARAG